MGRNFPAPKFKTMKLYFNKCKIREIIQAVENGTGHVVPYTGGFWGVPEDNTPGIMIVGDDGIYIIGNEKAEKSPVKSGLVAYARGCSPRNPYYREMKEKIWGGDDSGEFLCLEDAKRLLLGGKAPYVEVTPTTLTWGS